MRLPFLNHLLESVSAVAKPRRIVVLGSSSLLPGHPGLGDPGQALELSTDADLLLEAVGLRRVSSLCPREAVRAVLADKEGSP